MDVKLDKQSKIPVYLQIVDQLRAQIMCGALPSGERSKYVPRYP